MSHPIPRAAGPEPSSFSLTRAAQSQGCGSQSHRHHLLLNCTFTFTQTISKSWNKCRGRGGEGRVPLRGQDPVGFPRQAGREHQAASLGTSSPRARAQQASSSSHINTDTLNKNSISSSQGIKTSLEYVQQRARGGQS